ncbi:immunity 52 family protein [Paraburkholderia sp. MMS20-SJTN17]|uniref:Immunity 52 family protein n=1 Tax=Paraburkholderia translucens TaxID=2886945 RepID=A0ABS8KDU2_9BURK|nr:immunity 52 family protein [Paraburkholderia sp. MMS20-SJTN17]MCC8402933.1 immunity 52 family protein [Paraburkholderia sp. MMS20-SJTN17]
MNLSEQHRDRTDIPNADWESHMRRLRPILDLLKEKDRTLGEWYLKGETAQEALQHRAYDGKAPAKTAIEALSKEYGRKNKDDPKTVGIWNGIRSDQIGASLSLEIDGGEIFPKSLEISLNEKNERRGSRLGDYRSVAEVLSEVVRTYDSFYVTYGPFFYYTNKVFDDRPGVSWMLYLPHVLTSSEVPEARALIPVTRDGKQQGTIIVSVTDEVFDVNNRTHVKAANDIEIRLADQDLLPRYIDL